MSGMCLGGRGAECHQLLPRWPLEAGGIKLKLWDLIHGVHGVRGVQRSAMSGITPVARWASGGISASGGGTLLTIPLPRQSIALGTDWAHCALDLSRCSLLRCPHGARAQRHQRPPGGPGENN